MSKGKNYTVQQFVDGLKKLMKNDSSVANSPLYILTNNNVSSMNKTNNVGSERVAVEGFVNTENDGTGVFIITNPYVNCNVRANIEIGKTQDTDEVFDIYEDKKRFMKQEDAEKEKDIHNCGECSFCQQNVHEMNGQTWTDYDCKYLETKEVTKEVENGEIPIWCRLHR